jgi:hypothetical protein
MAISSQLAVKPRLAAEGARAGAEFGLGACTAAWRGRRYAGRLGVGALLLVVLASGVFIPPLTSTGVPRAIAGGIDAAVFAGAILLIALPPISWTDRLFLYQAGIVLLDARHPEPTVLRWAHLDTLTVTTASGYDDDYISGCVLRDRAGNVLTVGRHLKAINDVTAQAERVLAARLVPALIASFDSGTPVTVGHLTADQHGLSWGIAYGKADPTRGWQVPWPQIRAITFEMLGQRASMKTGWQPRDSRDFELSGQPNSFLIRYLIAHAAAIAGITVTGHAVNWDGESGWDQEATIIAPALAAFPQGQNWRLARKRRHPARTATIAALVIGILVGWALTFDHGGVVMQPGNGNGDDGDSVVSVSHLS